MKPATGEIYHVYNRGVEKRSIFLEETDYFRFIHDLFEFNDKEPAGRMYIPVKSKFSEVPLPKIKRKLLVEILVFCLMPNHFHLMLRQKEEGGITEFMRKLGTGYTNYFNQKNQRVGSLFQGIYKIVHISREAHFIHLPYYIHLNPLDLKFPGWRDGEIKEGGKALQFLESYRWSSYLDYIGEKNFPSVTNREFVSEFLGGPKQYKTDMIQWVIEHGTENLEPLTLE